MRTRTIIGLILAAIAIAAFFLILYLIYKSWRDNREEDNGDDGGDNGDDTPITLDTYCVDSINIVVGPGELQRAFRTRENDCDGEGILYSFKAPSRPISNLTSPWCVYKERESYLMTNTQECENSLFTINVYRSPDPSPDLIPVYFYTYTFGAFRNTYPSLEVIDRGTLTLEGVGYVYPV